MKQRLKRMPKQPLEVACALIVDDKKRLLLLRRHRDDLGGGLWASPGGRREATEQLMDTVRREVKEETGLEIADFTLLGTHELRMPHGVVHMQSYHAKVVQPVVVAIDPEEHHEYTWLPLDEVLTTPEIIWGLPTILKDFGLLKTVLVDPTLHDGSQALLLG
jgi:dATP pyrophosphohydrolase